MTRRPARRALERRAEGIVRTFHAPAEIKDQSATGGVLGLPGRAARVLACIAAVTRACEALRTDAALLAEVRRRLGGDASIVAASERALRLCNEERARIDAALAAKLLGDVLAEQTGGVAVTDADRAAWPRAIASARKHLWGPAVVALVEAEIGPVEAAFERAYAEVRRQLGVPSA